MQISFPSFAPCKFDVFRVLTIATSSLLFGTLASAQWIGASSDATNDAAHDYNTTTNWSGGSINDTFSASTALGSDTTLYFSANRVAAGNLVFGQSGAGALILQGGG